jgi:hypothetical protein
MIAAQDQKHIEWLREEYRGLPEEGYKRKQVDNLVSRFMELSETRQHEQHNQEALRNAVKLVLNQSQLALQILNTTRNSVNQLEHHQEAAFQPAVELKGQ